jgi:hypothetical protein
MTRWFTTLLYALMLACAALPAQAAVGAGAGVLTAVGLVAVDAASNDTDERAALSADAADGTSSSNDSSTPEVPELFFEALPRLALPVQTAEVPLSIAVPMSPHPFLKGPQRPPRSRA